MSARRQHSASRKGRRGDHRAVHASNAALSGSPQPGADDLIRNIAWDDSTGAISYLDTWASSDGGWNKDSDLNVQLSGVVPEPSAMLLLGIFAGTVGLFARKMRR